ncbi:MAG: fibronectin type III-like domain-contianing protein [Flavobacteriaceae bacterium]
MNAGESERVTFEVPAKDLAWYNPENKEWEIEEMEYEVYVGDSSRNSDLLKRKFTIIKENDDEK